MEKTINTTVEAKLTDALTRDVFVSDLISAMIAKDTLQLFDKTYGNIGRACWVYDNFLEGASGQLEIIEKGFSFADGKANKKAFLINYHKFSEKNYKSFLQNCTNHTNKLKKEADAKEAERLALLAKIELEKNPPVVVAAPEIIEIACIACTTKDALIISLQAEIQALKAEIVDLKKAPAKTKKDVKGKVALSLT